MSQDDFHSKPARVELISLIGYRGCGKTSVGRELARRLAWKFIDTDEMIETDAGRSITDIFASDGEKTFRILEAEAIEKVLAGRRLVIGVGGGAVLVRRNRKALRTAGACIWLTASADELYRRIQADEISPERRPPLTRLPGLEEIEAVLQARLPIYEATADYVVSTMGCSIDQVVAEIISRLRLHDTVTEGT